MRNILPVKPGALWTVKATLIVASIGITGDRGVNDPWQILSLATTSGFYLTVSACSFRDACATSISGPPRRQPIGVGPDRHRGGLAPDIRSMPRAVITGSAAGAVRKSISSRTAPACAVFALTPATMTM